MLMKTPKASNLPFLTRRRSAFVRLGDELVKVVYSDESGIGSIEEEPVTVVTALMFNLDSQWEPVERDLVEIQSSTPSGLLKYGYELHGKRLFSNIKRGSDAAIIALLSVLKIPIDHLVPVFYGAVDRAGFEADKSKKTELSFRQKRLTPYDVAFDACLRRIDSYVHTAFPQERILWIAEHSGHEKGLQTSLLWARATEKVIIEGEEQEMIRSESSHLADVIYFGNSEESRALQLADVCCATITRELLERHYGFRPLLAEAFYKTIQPQIVNDGTPPLFKSAIAG